MKEYIEHSLQLGIAAKKQFAVQSSDALLAVVDLLVSAFSNGNKVLIFGNGGSAADAQHLAAEFVNRFLIDRPPLAAVALTTDSSVLTSIGNDFSFDDIFAKQVIALGREGDVAIGISTSGNSTNVVLGIEAAVRQGMKTVALTGESGGRLADIVDILLAVPSRKTPVIQEVHLWIEHLVCQLVDEVLFGAKVS
ncbi:MAG: D-sedoheptulose 7-phosphate isomerase [Deltaproteobacteria bacterium]